MKPLTCCITPTLFGYMYPEVPGGTPLTPTQDAFCNPTAEELEHSEDTEFVRWRLCIIGESSSTMEK